MVRRTVSRGLGGRKGGSRMFLTETEVYSMEEPLKKQSGSLSPNAVPWETLDLNAVGLKGSCSSWDLITSCLTRNHLCTSFQGKQACDSFCSTKINFLHYTGRFSKCFQMKNTIKQCPFRKPLGVERANNGTQCSMYASSRQGQSQHPSSAST